LSTYSCVLLLTQKPTPEPSANLSTVSLHIGERTVSLCLFASSYTEPLMPEVLVISKHHFFSSKPIEPDRLFDCLPKSLRPTKGDHETDGAGRSDNPSKGLETAIYRTPTLVPPRILPLMNDIAQQLVQAGNQQSCYKIYRYF
jgi:hypothetical protein